MKNKELRVASYQLPAMKKCAPAAERIHWQLTTGNWQLPGFTLIELMISVALVIVLMVGIGKIFKMTSDTVGGGMAISTMARDDRAAQVTMQSDFAGAASDSPVFMILSERASAFLTPQDKLGDTDGNPMTVPDTSGSETASPLILQSAGGSAVSPGLYGDRNHRVDRIAFFARGQFNRQTSNDNTSFTGLPGSEEAYIWYGHVRLPGTTNGGSTSNPDVGTYQTGTTTIFPHIGYKTSNNASVDYDANSAYYESNPVATNWVLGREAILLQDESVFNNPTSAYYYSKNPTAHFWASTVIPVPLSPLGYRSEPICGNNQVSTLQPTSYPPLPNAQNNQSGFIYRSRYDLAGTTISGFRSIVTAAVNSDLSAHGAEETWWWPLVYDTNTSQVNTTATTPIAKSLPYRFQCNPYISKPITGTGMAQTTPYFIPHVTQFIVEYAGDYITQSATTGVPTAVGADGAIDFYVDTGTGARHIRWYGFPRDTSNPTGGAPDGKILTWGAMIGGAAITYNQLTDVVPLRDVLNLVPGATAPANFERDVTLAGPATDSLPLPAGGDYAGLTGLPHAGYPAHYDCIWRNSAPKLVRIVMKIDDPNGRVGQGRWIEQVFAIQ